MLMKGTKIPNLPLSGHAPRFNGFFLGAFPILPISFIKINLALIDLSCLESNKPNNRGEHINLPVGDKSHLCCLSVFFVCFWFQPTNTTSQSVKIPGYSLVLLCCPSYWPRSLCSPRYHTGVFWLQSPPRPLAPCSTLRTHGRKTL